VNVELFGRRKKGEQHMLFNSSWCCAIAAALMLVLCSPAHAGGKAKEAGPEDGRICCDGFTSFFFADDQVLVITGRAGVFRSQHHGDKWERSMNGLVRSDGVAPYVAGACQSQSRPSAIYALGGIGAESSTFNGLFSSGDFGRNWTRRGQINTGFGFNVCAVDVSDPNTVYVTGFDDNSFDLKTWRSTDGGETIQDISNLLPDCAVGGVIYTAPGNVFVAGDCIVVSTNGGASFDAFPAPPGLVAGLRVRLDGAAVFIGIRDANFNFIGWFRTTDGGASYVPVGGLPTGANFAFDPTHPSRIYASTGQLKVSQDGGLTFTPLPTDPRMLGPLPVGFVGVDPRGSVFVENLAGLFRSDDGGNKYRSLLNEFRASSVQDLAFDADGKLLVGVIHTQAVFRETHDRKFSALGTSLIDPNGIPGITVDAASVAGSPTDPNLILTAIGDTFGLSFNSPLLRTDNGGQSWTNATITPDPGGFPRSRMSFATASRVYLVAPFTGLYRSDDAGQSFALLSDLPFGALAVDPTNPDKVYLGTFGESTGLFKSTDAGETLQSLNHIGDFSSLLVDRRDSNVILAGERTGQVLRSTDGGQTFAPSSTGLTGAGVHGLAQDAKGTFYAWLRGGGLFSSKDGAKWKKVDSDEALLRSGVEAGRGTLVADPRHAGRLYLGNAGVIQIDD
jgi:photosystem II stability/assembly factor-like uncharacterized protein